MNTLVPVRVLDSRARTWIANQLLEGRDPLFVEDELSRLGVARDVASREVASAVNDPYLHAAKVHLRRGRKSAQILEMYHALWRRSRDAQAIPEFGVLHHAEFVRDYYCNNRAVIVRGGASHWPAVGRWTPGYFKEQFPAAEIEFMRGAQRYGRADARSRGTMSEFVERVEATRASNEFYIVATNFSLRNEKLRALSADLSPLPFVPEIDFDDPRVTRLWFGPRGTITPLHHDVMNVVLVQVFGRKEVRLAPSFCMPMVYNTSGLRSDVDPIVIDRKRVPRAESIAWLKATLEPGDALFIPLGWWHWVYALETSISIGLGDFTIDSEYDEWKAVDIERPVEFPLSDKELAR